MCAGVDMFWSDLIWSDLTWFAETESLRVWPGLGTVSCSHHIEGRKLIRSERTSPKCLTSSVHLSDDADKVPCPQVSNAISAADRVSWLWESQFSQPCDGDDRSYLPGLLWGWRWCSKISLPVIKTCIRPRACRTSGRKGFVEPVSLFTIEDQSVVAVVDGLCFQIRGSFFSFICGLNLGDGWDTQLIFPMKYTERSSCPQKIQAEESHLSRSSQYLAWNPGRINWLQGSLTPRAGCHQHR